MLSRNKKSKTKTVSEKVTDIILHPNGENQSSDESGEEATAPKVVDYDEDDYELPDARSSDIRKKNIRLLSDQSARYRGKIASRNSNSDDEDQEQDGESDHSDDELQTIPFQPSDSNDEGPSSANESEQSEYDDDEDDDNDNDSYDEDDEGKIIDDSDILTESNRQAEIQKGVCVRNQLNIWEKMLELRIHSKKMLNKSNLLPEPEAFRNEQKENKAIGNTAKESALKVAKLLHNLLELQQALQGQFSEIQTTIKNTKKRALPPITDTKTGVPPTKRYAEYLEQSFNDFKPYRNTVLLKWDDRTKLLTPGAGSKKKSMNEEYDIIRKIDNALLNRSALIEKSQTLKGQDMNLKSNDSDAENNDNKLQSHIYDDTDFYHQQLRELIEYKANSSSNVAEVTKQLIELQKIRQKMKKKVDTRASKGRKIRYIVHKKLVNFMAPNDTSSWTEESKNELCKSLFVS